MAGKLLIAEDNDSIRGLLKILFQNEGYELFLAEDGDQALQLALEAKPEVVILDVMMPGKSGYEVCEALRQNPATQGSYILFLTSRTGVTAETAMRNSGGDEIMSKPFNPNELKEKVRRAMISGPEARARSSA